MNRRVLQVAHTTPRIPGLLSSHTLEFSSSLRKMVTRHAPLYAFSLPSDLINDFQPRQLHIPETHPLHPSNKVTLPPPEPAPSTSTLAIGGAFTCALTGASFPDLPSLREHYKTDWYKYNVKLRLQGKPTGITEEQFDALVEGEIALYMGDGIAGADSGDLSPSGLSASISGSDSSSSSSSASSSSSTNAVSRLLRKQRLKGGPTEPSDDIDDLTSMSGPRSAVIWFEAPQVAPGTQYGIYRAALPSAGGGKKRADGTDGLDELKTLQLPEQVKGASQGDGNKERKWTLLMFGGGHFAGMVVSLVPKLVSRGKGKEKEKEVVILEKKTFHRYTSELQGVCSRRCEEGAD